MMRIFYGKCLHDIIVYCACVSFISVHKTGSSVYGMAYMRKIRSSVLVKFKFWFTVLNENFDTPSLGL